MITGVVKEQSDPSRAVPFIDIYFIDEYGDPITSKGQFQSDVNGEFSILEAEPGDTLRFHSIAHHNQELDITWMTPGSVTVLMPEKTYMTGTAVVVGEKTPFYKSLAFKVIMALVLVVIILMATRVIKLK